MGALQDDFLRPRTPLIRQPHVRTQSVYSSSFPRSGSMSTPRLHSLRVFPHHFDVLSQRVAPSPAARRQVVHHASFLPSHARAPSSLVSGQIDRPRVKRWSTSSRSTLRPPAECHPPVG